jgi:hypothetical protein
VRDVRRASERNPSYPPILFFFQGTAADGASFFGRYWPEVRAVADLAQRFFVAFAIGRGGARELFGPGVWLAGLRASLKGNTAGRAMGDPWRMPGIFLVREDRVLWAYTYRHAGDHPQFDQIPARLAAAGVGSPSTSS